jgi:hypothetical protein
MVARLIQCSTLIALVLLFGSSANAWNEPEGFRDIPWGSSPAFVKERLPGLSCGSSGRCLVTLQIGEVQSSVMFGFEAVDGGMDSVYLRFPSGSFYQMKVTFTERYGEPTSRKSQALQNQMGAKFENEILEWDGEKVRIRLAKYSSKLTDSDAIIETVEGYRARLEKFREKAKEGKKDL